MATSHHLAPGMTISIKNKLYRVEASLKVAAPKGAPFIKAKLKDLDTQKIVEMNFKPDQAIKEVTMNTRQLEYLYMEGKNYLFLDVAELEQVLIPHAVVGAKAHYLKEGIDVMASFFGDTIYAIELPQFVEIMVSKTEQEKGKAKASSNKLAVLETGAKVEVPSFIEAGDIIKVDTRLDEYIQRV